MSVTLLRAWGAYELQQQQQQQHSLLVPVVVQSTFTFQRAEHASQDFLPPLRSLLDLDGRVIRVEIIRLDRRYAYLDTGFKSNLRFIKKNLKPSQLVREAPVRSQAQSSRQVFIACTVFSALCTSRVSSCTH